MEVRSYTWTMVTLWGLAEPHVISLLEGTANDGSDHLPIHEEAHALLVSGILPTVPQFVASIVVSLNLVHLTSTSLAMSHWYCSSWVSRTLPNWCNTGTFHMPMDFCSLNLIYVLVPVTHFSPSPPWSLQARSTVFIDPGLDRYHMMVFFLAYIHCPVSGL